MVLRLLTQRLLERFGDKRVTQLSSSKKATSRSTDNGLSSRSGAGIGDGLRDGEGTIFCPWGLTLRRRLRVGHGLRLHRGGRGSRGGHHGRRHTEHLVRVHFHTCAQFTTNSVQSRSNTVAPMPVQQITMRFSYTWTKCLVSYSCQFETPWQLPLINKYILSAETTSSRTVPCLEHTAGFATLCCWNKSPTAAPRAPLRGNKWL